MGALVSLAAAPMSMAAQCCGSLAGGCAASLLCKACSCSCVASPKVASALYFGGLTFFVFLAMCFRFNGGDLVIGGGFNRTEASILDHLAHSGTQGALDYWNSRFYCAPAHPSGLVICCANVCAGVYAVYRFSFALCIFFAFLTLCTAGTTKWGARAHRGFWFLKAFTLLSLLVTTLFIDNEAMSSYREVARYTSLLFLVMQILLLIDFGYRINEYFVELDERSDSDSFCSYKMCLLGAAVVLYAGAITLWVLMAQWFGGDGCGAQQTLITVTIIVTLSLSIVSCTKVAPHGTLLTSAVVTAYASYQCYSALAAHPDAQCNATESTNGSDFVVGVLVFGVAMISMAGAAWSATSSKDKILGTSTSGGNDLTVNLDTGAGGASDAAGGGDDEQVGPESWWYYHLMMVVSSLYMAMLLTNWSIQPVDRSPDIRKFNVSYESFWIKIVAQWVCLLMYAWTLLAPYLLRNHRDFGIEFDFD